MFRPWTPSQGGSWTPLDLFLGLIYNGHLESVVLDHGNLVAFLPTFRSLFDLRRSVQDQPIAGLFAAGEARGKIPGLHFGGSAFGRSDSYRKNRKGIERI